MEMSNDKHVLLDTPFHDYSSNQISVGLFRNRENKI